MHERAAAAATVGIPAPQPSGRPSGRLVSQAQQQIESILLLLIPPSACLPACLHRQPLAPALKREEPALYTCRRWRPYFAFSRSWRGKVDKRAREAKRAIAIG